MRVRPEVADLINFGQLPSEDASDESISMAQTLLEEIQPPVTDDEAQALVSVFGSDNCYGLSWELVHLTETAPGATTAKYRNDSGNEWVNLLNARVEAASSGEAY